MSRYSILNLTVSEPLNLASIDIPKASGTDYVRLDKHANKTNCYELTGSSADTIEEFLVTSESGHDFVIRYWLEFNENDACCVTRQIAHSENGSIRLNLPRVGTCDMKKIHLIIEQFYGNANLQVYVRIGLLEPRVADMFIREPEKAVNQQHLRYSHVSIENDHVHSLFRSIYTKSLLILSSMPLDSIELSLNGAFLGNSRLEMPFFRTYGQQHIGEFGNDQTSTFLRAHSTDMKGSSRKPYTYGVPVDAKTASIKDVLLRISASKPCDVMIIEQVTNQIMYPCGTIRFT